MNDVPLNLFRAQLETALGLGYRFVRADVIASGRGGPHDLAITFDDGLRSVSNNAEPVLAELGIPWSLFVVCDWVQGRHGRPDLFLGWGDVSRLLAAGIEIGSHSMSHPDFGGLDHAAASRELWESRLVINEKTGAEVESFAIPFGQSRNWRSELSRLARSLGYRSIYAQAADTRTEGTVARTFVTRFDAPRVFTAALEGAFDQWEEPV